MEEKRKEEIENSDTDVEMVPDEEALSADAAAKVKKLREELQRCEAGKREYLEGWQRAKADLINYKKDEARRFDEFLKFAAEGLIAELVPALDSFDLALQHGMPKDVERGIVMIRSQLEDILRRRGLEVLQPRGQKFDPAFHESLGEVETEGEEGTVAEVLQPGYLLQGKLLRPARVKIAKKK
ncbi:MAG: nucleotide exchange factor GrpE [Candidatus Sungbacteria bacterium]|uniref:Protein GrpE n=1 Tax=Candidatus Sungiibacteriota bacterium TaxID=2750080 RepID=A0A932YXV0_9BACT|nr:nucleotide exchange factor GrpE [Candidatus Sungbacteria bacterium]